jgi:hypothetical protein
MRPELGALELAEALEQAYRLALSVEALATGRASAAKGQAISVTSKELLDVLDQARASLLRPSASSRTGW